MQELQMFKSFLVDAVWQMQIACRMAVLNDFEACGYGVPALQPEDLLVLNDVPARRKVCLGFHYLCRRLRPRPLPLAAEHIASMSTHSKPLMHEHVN